MIASLDTIDLMRFIDIFGKPPEMIPDGNDFSEIIDFLKENEFHEEQSSRSHWKSFVKVHDELYFLLNIYQNRCAPPWWRFDYTYTYEVMIRVIGTGVSFKDKNDNLRKALCNAFAYIVNKEESNGDTGNSSEQTA